MRPKNKKEDKETLVIPLSKIGGKDQDLKGSARKIESMIWARMREISRLTNEKIDALPEGEFDELYTKAVESE